MADKWHFLEPWLELLAPHILPDPDSGWQPDMNGAASLAPRLAHLSISILRSCQHYQLAPPQLRTLRRAMEIVTLALRVDPQVWKLLQIIHWGTFKDRHDAAAAVESVQWLLLGEECIITSSDRSAVSAAAYKDALARIRCLNSFRVPLDDPIPLDWTFISKSSTEVNDQIVAMASNANENHRFEMRGLPAVIYPLPYRYRECATDLFQRLQQTGITSMELQSFRDLARADCTVNMTQNQHGFRTKRLALEINNDWQVVTTMRFAVGRAVDASDAQNRAPWDCEDADVERLELQAHWSPTRGCVDPLELTAEHWVRHTTCRLLPRSRMVDTVQQTLQEIDTSTELHCIPGNDPSVMFLIIPSTKELVRVATEDLQISNVNASTATPPPRWLAKVRSLRVTHSEVVTLAAIPQLRHLMPSLVSLDLTSDPTWGDVLPSIFLSLPSSLQYLQLHGWADSPSHLRALFQAYDDNALRVRSRKIDFKELQSLLRLLTASSNPTSGIASHLEELSVRFSCRLVGDDAETVGDAIEQILLVNERLNYFHIRGGFPSQIRDQWRAKVAPFHRTLVRNRVGRHLPRACVLALMSVADHYEYALGTDVLANIVAFANGALVRIAMVRT